MKFFTIRCEDAFDALGSRPEGLTQTEAERLLKIHGANELASVKKPTLAARFFAQLKDFMIIILLLAAAVSFSVSLLEGRADFVDPIIILVIVILNAVLGVIQETKAEHSLEALKKLSAPQAHVLRNGKKQLLPAASLVPGDIIFLDTGSLVPADARLLSAAGLRADESALTGETIPLEKNPFTTFPEDTPLGDRLNMVFASSVITSGHGSAIVTATGMETEVGHIADMILHDETPDTPLQKKLAATGKLLGCGALLICLVIFLLGVFQGFPVFTMFMTSVSLAVASIPESLPAVVTIMLSLGVQRMAKKQAVIRRLPAVETLGSATYICSDKTGTLTKNRMTVTKTSVITKISRLPSGLSGYFSSTPVSAFPSAAAFALLCSNVDINTQNGKTTVLGEATEQALAEYALSQGISPSILTACPRVFEIPFDSAKKYMATVHRLPSQSSTSGKEATYLLIVKGACDVLLPYCGLTRAAERSCRARHDAMTAEALRVIAVACRLLPENFDFHSPDLLSDLTLLSLFGLMDPPREEAANAVALCKQAGITPVMITGDHKNTACAIGRMLGILAPGDLAMTGTQLDGLSEDELAAQIPKYKVFARVSPEHKVRIVKALKKNGEVVAMTGDGVNDAPALKAADIGCAMGRSGTDVAKSAADMVLLDDNFATIVAAVLEGRGIYENIRKAIHFLLSCNIGEIMTIFLAILFRMPSPLAAVQLLWVNLITDSLPAIALGVEPPERDVMQHPPRKEGASIFTAPLTAQIVLEGMMIGALTLLSYVLGSCFFGNAGTMAFAVLSLSQLFHAFNIRSRHSLFEIGIFSNKKMVLSFVICAFLQLLVITHPVLQEVFKVASLTKIQWGIVAACSIAPIIFVELQKFVAKIKKWD